MIKLNSDLPMHLTDREISTETVRIVQRISNFGLQF